MARVLLSTIPPYDGGVPAKCAILARHLRDCGHQVTVAYYATWGHEPDLVAPSWKLWRGQRPGAREGICFDDFPSIAIGCWLPELEVSYYAGSSRWDQVMAAHDRHIAVGGNVLVAHRLVKARLPHMVWCGTPMLEDRLDRQRQMPKWRRALDRNVTVPILQSLERRVLSDSPMILPVSSYSADGLARLGRKGPLRVLPVPVDTDMFAPSSRSVRTEPVIGFAGRLNDPRKNLGLLIDAMAVLVKKGVRCRLRLTGDPSADVASRIVSLGLSQHVDWTGILQRHQLPDFYRSLDVFALPSWQEGLGIVGVEALACGVPVVSTRNGGAQDYVLPYETGLLTDFSVSGFADALETVLANETLHRTLADNARALAVSVYGMESWRRNLAQAWSEVWGDWP